ncbi:MAG TPA: KH domain-containing protein [Anaerolineae bacterium]|nr:KH domain-containing protein [Anaerolineae bacterium]
MNAENRREIEVRGDDVDQAVANGLAQLGLSRDEVEIEVLDEGSRGLLGLGAREAVVVIKPLSAEVLKKEERPESEPAPELVAEVVEVEPEPEPEPEIETVAEAVEVEPVADTAVTETTEEPKTSQEEAEAERQAAQATIETLLAKMQVTATVTTSISKPDDVTGRQINVIEIHGDDLGVLIGPRGDTLNAMQYLARLIVGHDLHQRITFVVDVEGYRQRRELALSRLAERMAGKVVKRQRPVSLEPMPPHERRIIHMTLRDSEDVYTESSGEGKYRKVKIWPKE